MITFDDWKELGLNQEMHEEVYSRSYQKPFPMNRVINIYTPSTYPEHLWQRFYAVTCGIHVLGTYETLEDAQRVVAYFILFGAHNGGIIQ